MKKSNIIGVYGGSFDPVHLGHLRFAELAAEFFNLEKVIFVPTYKLPHVYKEKVSSYNLRYEMLKLAIAQNKKFEVSDIEAKREEKSYTIDTLKEIRKLYNNKIIAFLMGSDSFLKIDTWKSWEILIREFIHIIAVRPGAEMSKLKAFMKKYKLNYKIFTIKEKPQDLLNLNILKDKTILDISSTLIRKRTKEGKSVRYLVPEEVNNLIISKDLYKEE